jgi:uncharacterized MAPEG superfamily protein
MKENKMILSIELKMLLWSSVLGIIQLLIATSAKTSQAGLVWNLSPRDRPFNFTGVASRLDRAFKNFMETFPFFVVAILIVQMTTLGNHVTGIGAQLYFWARLIYVPLYALGIPGVRTVVWMLSLVGLMMVLSALFF